MTADIENMFHQFAVPHSQRTYMRLFWYRDNDARKEIVEYYSRVHVMGLCSSPAIANVGIRFAARKHPPNIGHAWLEEDAILDPHQTNQKRIPDEVEKVLENSFYVDDFLTSQPTPERALVLIKKRIARFQRYDLKLCKVQSNLH